MVINTKEGMVLSSEKVVFEKNGKKEEKVIGSEGKKWWENLAEKNNNISIIEFLQVDHPKEIVERFNDVKDENIDFGVAEKYIITGEITKDIKLIKLQKENSNLRDELTSTQEAVDFLAMNGGL